MRVANFYRVAPLLGAFFLSLSAHGQIATDGTVGAAVSLSGPVFTIPNTLGTQTGSNLFHSFQTLNVLTGESATFTGPAGIDNVISRVTGGQESQINGLLRSTVPDADFWFLNPAGVMFGQGAEVDVPASLFISTGDEVRFDNGAVFNATTPSVSTLTLASPEAFGFLGDSPASILVSQSTIELGAGETLSLVGGDIEVSQANLSAGNVFSFLEEPAAGFINLVATSSANEVNAYDGTTFNDADGIILLLDSSEINASGNGGGTVRIRAGAFGTSGTDIRANNFGAESAGEGVRINADVVLLTNDTAISAGALDQGNAVPVVIEATSIELDDSFISTSSTGSFADDVGNADDIIISTDDLLLTNNSCISSDTFLGSNGDGGSIVIQADLIELYSCYPITRY